MKRSAVIGLSEYTSQRLAELQALRESSNGTPEPLPDRKPLTHSYNGVTRFHDDGIGSSRSGSSGSEGVTSPGSTDVSSSTARVALPSAALESRRGIAASSKVGYTSLALPPDGSYRPFRSSKISQDGDLLYDKYSRHARSGNLVLAESAAEEGVLLEPVPSLSLAKSEETHKKSKTLDNLDAGKKSMAIATDDGLIGFAKLPDQVHRKAIKRGFDFTLMVVGESGLGKSTLISSMFFQDDLYKNRIIPEAAVCVEKLRKTVDIEKRQLEIEEHGVRLRLTIVDTPGFNEALNSTDSWKPITKYVQDQYEQYLKDESGLNRQTIQDNRVHCCLYFISPFGRGLRQIDVDFMKRLQHRVNIVPIIAKADVLTVNEMKQLKSKVMAEIRAHNIQIYELPPTDNDEDEDFKKKDRALKAAYPFAVIGGNTTIEVDGKRVKGRVYPWGIVEAENPQYSDVSLLRQFLVSTHLHDLKDVTKDVHYENFRASTIDQKPKTLPMNSTKPDAERLLKEKEEEIRRMHLVLQKMQTQLNGGHAR